MVVFMFNILLLLISHKAEGGLVEFRLTFNILYIIVFKFDLRGAIFKIILIFEDKFHEKQY